MQRDRQNPKSERTRAFKQLMGGIIHRVLGIIESVNMKIDFDPILFFGRARLPRRSCAKVGAHARFERQFRSRAGPRVRSESLARQTTPYTIHCSLVTGSQRLPLQTLGWWND